MALKAKNPIRKSEANSGGTRRGMVWNPGITKAARKVNKVGGKRMMANVGTMESKIKF
jgi:hypothetical protein